MEGNYYIVVLFVLIFACLALWAAFGGDGGEVATTPEATAPVNQECVWLLGDNPAIFYTTPETGGWTLIPVDRERGFAYHSDNPHEVAFKATRCKNSWWKIEILH